MLVCCREDEFDATYCYGSGSTNQDIHDRTILPLVCKLIEGYNVCVLLTGGTGVVEAICITRGPKVTRCAGHGACSSCVHQQQAAAALEAERTLVVGDGRCF